MLKEWKSNFFELRTCFIDLINLNCLINIVFKFPILELKYRAESSCLELIKNAGISRIHFGVLDTLHVPSISEYIDAGFTTTLSLNSNLKTICSNLMALFAKYDSRINKELLAIKNELGDEFFSAINNE